MSLAEKFDAAIAAVQELGTELIATLEDARDAIPVSAAKDSGAPEVATVTDAAAGDDTAPAALKLAEPSVDAEQVRVAEEGHDNEKPFKCPACGATYDGEGTCANGHAPEQVLATKDVLAGAAPAAERDPSEEQAEPAAPVGTDASSDSSSTTEAGDANKASDLPTPAWPS